jgi:hypothetical protein
MERSSHWRRSDVVNRDVATNLVTNNILTAIGIGAAVGIVIVVLIALVQFNQRVNSLTDVQDCVDAIVTVRVPFNQNTVGSIWIDRADQRIVMAAKSREVHEFLRGDRAIVVEIRDGKAWISHTDQSWSS